MPQKVCSSQPDPVGRPAAEGAGLVTPATRGPAGTCFTGREAGFMIRSGDGGGARRELRSPPTVPAQRGTGGCVPYDCDLTAAGIPADGMSCRYCHAVTHTARKDGTNPAQCVRSRRPRPCCRNSAGAGPGEDRAGRGPLPEFADRRLAGIPRHPAGAIRRPIRDRCPDPAPLTSARSGICTGAAMPGLARIRLLTGQLAMIVRVPAPVGIPFGRRGGRTTSCALAGLPAASREGAAHIRPYPHTAPALFTAGAPAVLAGRK